MFLVEKMGFGWESVHEIAEQIEHIRAPEFFEKMDELLGYPKTDPHGSPIPDKAGRVPAQHYIRLSDCLVGEHAKVATVTHSSQDFLKFLNSRELALGTVLGIRSVESYDGSMTVSYEQHPAEMLSRQVCDLLLVEKV
jgi:DtxR family Mn-dependent transcriptional regulator